MYKRIVFFFSYILFFILVQFCFSLFRQEAPVKLSDKELWKQMDSTLVHSFDIVVEPGGVADTFYYVDGQLINQSLSQENLIDASTLNRINRMADNARGVLNAGTAVMICFPISVLITFFISLYKFRKPGSKLGGMSIAISIFNILYIPAYLCWAFFRAPIFGLYYFWESWAYFTSPHRAIILLLMLALISASFILTILGVSKGRRHSGINSQKN